MTEITRKQYNGIILLTGYLQRLFVAETIYKQLNELHDSSRFEKVKSLLDEAYKIVPVVEETQQLTLSQKAQLKSITDQTEELMSTYFKPLPLSFNEKLAIVGSSLYAEQHVNAGIIRLGEVFKVEVNKDFHMRTKFYQDRTKMIDYLVHVIHKNEQPDEQFAKLIEPMFNDVMRNQNHILEDIKQIEELIGL